jgi:hypothetical protein
VRLIKDSDFRMKEYRREVFLRFYEFHLRYRSHAGAVYYVMPYLAEQLGWGMEEKLWFAYINGNTQNPITSHIIFSRFPEIKGLDINALGRWFHDPSRYGNLAWDTDRRYHKKQFVDFVRNYLDLLKGRTQEEYFDQICATADPHENFRRTWEIVRSQFVSFGRLSAFSYLEYLRIMGVNLDCDQLFLEDMNGSKSHRNGLCKVIGRDDLDWHESNPGFDGYYSPEILGHLGDVAEGLLSESRRRAIGEDWLKDVSYFTLETALCTYKSWHRPNRRYPNVYNDMFHDRIVHAEQRWVKPRMKIFWDARRANLSPNLRLEDNPLDVGLKPRKQNHYLRTGQVIMMEQIWPCFENDYSRRYITA